MKKQTIYIESTIPSYLVARPSRDLLKLSRQIASRQWWDEVLPSYDPYVSRYVLQEISDGDPQAATRRQKAIEGFTFLETSEQIEKLALVILKKIRIPEKSKIDAYHLAIAITHGMDYVISWNFNHIVGPPVRKTFAEIGRELNLVMPILCTPSDFLGEI